MAAGRSGQTNEEKAGGLRNGIAANPAVRRSAREQQHSTRQLLSGTRVSNWELGEFALTLNSSVAAKALED